MRKLLKATCVTSCRRYIEEMEDAAREVSRRTFLKHVDPEDRLKLECILGYAKHPKHGLTMAADYAVRYYRAKFKGELCYYVDWSSIFYIFA